MSQPAPSADSSTGSFTGLPTAAIIGFIGAGNMAQSIIGGLLGKGWPPSQILASAPSPATRQQVADQFGIRTSAENQVAAQADIVCLCVKPALVRSVLAELAPVLNERQPLLISVAAGITMDNLEAWAGQGRLAMVRSMPNTPALLGFGATGLFANRRVSGQQKNQVEAIFKAVGLYEWVDQEDLIDAVIAVSGSGPAYFFLFMEMMTAAATELGLEPEVAARLTVQTALGAAKMAEGSVDVAELRRRVCSPGGATEQAVAAFQQGGLDKLIRQAMAAARLRAKAMAEELGK